MRKRDFLEHVLTCQVRGSLTRETAPGIVYCCKVAEFRKTRNVRTGMHGDMAGIERRECFGTNVLFERDEFQLGNIDWIKLEI